MRRLRYFFKKRTTLAKEAVHSLSYDIPKLEQEIETLFHELGHDLPFPAGNIQQATDLELDVLLSVLQAEQAKKSDTSFLLTIFSSIIGLISVITTDLLEGWTLRHLLIAVFIWTTLLMIIQKFYDHRIERLTLLSAYIETYKAYRNQ